MPESTDRWTLDFQPANQGETARLVISGEFDMAPVPAFEAQMARLHDEGTPVVVDLRGLTFLDSCGTCSLVRAAWRAPEVRMVRPEGRAWGVIELSAMDR